MDVLSIKHKNIISYIFNVLSKTPNIKAKDIDISHQNNCPYIHIDINIFDKSKVEVTYATNSFVNDEEEDPNNDKYIEILGLNPDAVLKGPVEYKEIENIYEYFYGPTNDIIDEHQEVFFYIGETLLEKLNEIYNSL